MLAKIILSSLLFLQLDTFALEDKVCALEMRIVWWNFAIYLILVGSNDCCSDCTKDGICFVSVVVHLLWVFIIQLSNLYNSVV
jgi:hypothetical protein